MKQEYSQSIWDRYHKGGLENISVPSLQSDEVKKRQRWIQRPSLPSGWLVRKRKASSADLAFLKLRGAQRCQVLCYHTLATFNLLCELTRF